MKPDVIAQTLQLEKERAKMAEDAAAAGGGPGGKIILQQEGQPPVTLNNQQVVQILQNLQVDVEARNKEIAQLKSEYAVLLQKYELLLKADKGGDKEADSVATTEPEIIYV